MEIIKRGKKAVTNLIGHKFNRLEVVEYLGLGKWNKHYWGCVCTCGGKVNLPTGRITGNTRPMSCGCYRNEKLSERRFDGVKHGLSKLKLYAIFHSMHQRCINPKSCRWQYYGGKGIKVCEEWQTIQNFYDWAIINGYEEGLSIDRVDSESDYKPSNCRWITLAANTRRAHLGKRKPKI